MNNHETSAIGMDPSESNPPTPPTPCPADGAPPPITPEKGSCGFRPRTCHVAKCNVVAKVFLCCCHYFRDPQIAKPTPGLVQEAGLMQLPEVGTS